MPFLDPDFGDAGAATLPHGRSGARSQDVRGRRRAPPRLADLLAGSLLAGFLRAPAYVGGIAPASPALARALSAQAAGYATIVELGAGTGAVTRRLAADHPRAALIVIERDPTLLRTLGVRARVRIGCVHECEAELLALPPGTIAVSSLPFRSLPQEVVQATVATLERFLVVDPARRLVQYSYGLRAPFRFGDARLRWHRGARVWRNVPPARVWVAGLDAAA